MFQEIVPYPLLSKGVLNEGRDTLAWAVLNCNHISNYVRQGYMYNYVPLNYTPLLLTGSIYKGTVYMFMMNMIWVVNN